MKARIINGTIQVQDQTFLPPAMGTQAVEGAEYEVYPLPWKWSLNVTIAVGGVPVTTETWPERRR